MYRVEFHAQNLTGSLRQELSVDSVVHVGMHNHIYAFLTSVLCSFPGQTVTLRMLLPKGNGLKYPVEVTNEEIYHIAKLWSRHVEDNL